MDISQVLLSAMTFLTGVMAMANAYFDFKASKNKRDSERVNTATPDAAAKHERIEARSNDRRRWSFWINVSLHSFSLLFSIAALAFLAVGPLSNSDLTVGIAALMCMAITNVVMALAGLKP